jgi:purine-binding chemotaxis protein CheW
MTELHQSHFTSISDAEIKEQYVSFIIEDEYYGVDILKVQEIVGMSKITVVPNMMNYMKGVINLRGRVVPVVDMRLKFRMAERQYDQVTVILIVEVKGKEVGMIVDSVSDVIEIPRNKIQETHQFKASIEADFIKGIGNLDNMLVILLDVDRILSSEELEHIEKNKSV